MTKPITKNASARIQSTVRDSIASQPCLDGSVNSDLKIALNGCGRQSGVQNYDDNGVLARPSCEPIASPRKRKAPVESPDIRDQGATAQTAAAIGANAVCSATDRPNSGTLEIGRRGACSSHQCQ